MRHWFRPVRFWKWFAAYYPATWQGWLITTITFLFKAMVFFIIYSRSSSLNEAIIDFVPWALVSFLVLDFLSLHKGEYPHWWGERKHLFSRRRR